MLYLILATRNLQAPLDGKDFPETSTALVIINTCPCVDGVVVFYNPRFR